MDALTTSSISIDRALADKQLLGAAIGDLSTWGVWLATLRAAFGEELTEAELATFHAIAGDRAPPEKRVEELWAIVGRGGGKSRVAAAIAVYIACFIKHDLDPGERGFVLALAASQAQAKIVFSYCQAFLHRSPVLRGLVVASNAFELKLSNNLTIAVHANSWRSIRGRALLAVIGDEVSSWRDELSANPDKEVMVACKPALVRCNGVWIGISTPYARRGLLFERYQNYYDVDGDDVLVVKGPSIAFNPTLDEAKIAKELKRDPLAAAEWSAEFRTDVTALLDDRVIDDAVDTARPLELPPRPGQRYYAFCDPSGGRQDAMTLNIGHLQGKTREDAIYVCDVLRGVAPPFDPRSVTQEFAQLARQYRCPRITGDAFSGEWVTAAFGDAGIKYEVSPLTKSQLYIESVGAFNTGRVSIPDHAALILELKQLERRTARSGRDAVDHPRSGHDDYANALVGGLYTAMHELHRPKMKQGAIAFGTTGKVTWQDRDEPPRAIRIVRVTEQEALRQKAEGIW